MIKRESRNERRKLRHLRLRKRVRGTAERPRLSVFRSNRYIYVQVVDDVAGHTLTAASSLEPELRRRLAAGGTLEAARQVGELVARRALERGIRKVVFDRGGYKYHGRVAAVAEGARSAGLEF